MRAKANTPVASSVGQQHAEEGEEGVAGLRRALDELLDVSQQLPPLPIPIRIRIRIALGVADVERGVELQAEGDAPEVLRELLERPRAARLAGARGHLRLQETD